MPVHNPPIVKQSFTTNMNYYSRLNDSDVEWLLVNNETSYKLGTADKVVDDTTTLTLSSANQAIARTAWFLTPFDMTVTNISGTIMDDDFSNHVNMYYIGIWVVSGVGNDSDTPSMLTGTPTITLKYVTQDYGATDAFTGVNEIGAFYDSSPSLNLVAGDLVWAGHLNQRFDGTDDMTLTMTLCAEKDE